MIVHRNQSFHSLAWNDHICTCSQTLLPITLAFLPFSFIPTPPAERSNSSLPIEQKPTDEEQIIKQKQHTYPKSTKIKIETIIQSSPVLKAIAGAAGFLSGET